MSECSTVPCSVILPYVWCIHTGKYINIAKKSLLLTTLSQCWNTLLSSVSSTSAFISHSAVLSASKKALFTCAYSHRMEYFKECHKIAVKSRNILLPLPFLPADISVQSTLSRPSLLHRADNLHFLSPLSFQPRGLPTLNSCLLFPPQSLSPSALF